MSASTGLSDPHRPLCNIVARDAVNRLIGDGAKPAPLMCRSGLTLALEQTCESCAYVPHALNNETLNCQIAPRPHELA